MDTFKTDEETIQYLKEKINIIKVLDECRLTNLEQIHATENIFHFRNCVEWIIRSNELILNIRYAMKKSLEYAEAILWPLEETDNNRFFAYYLEDAVYRDFVLWELFKQLLNEYHKCGYTKEDKITIFKFIENTKSKIGIHKYDIIYNYLKSEPHQFVRNTLRHSFTHSIGATSSYMFHEMNNDKIEPNLDHLFPNHPFENIHYVINDVSQLLQFMNETINEMLDYRNENLILLEVNNNMPCGKNFKDSDYWHMSNLKKFFDFTFVSCDSPCHEAHEYNGHQVCKPKKICYKRASSNNEEIDILNTSLTFDDVIKKLDDNAYDKH